MSDDSGSRLSEDPESDAEAQDTRKSALLNPGDIGKLFECNFSVFGDLSGNVVVRDELQREESVVLPGISFSLVWTCVCRRNKRDDRISNFWALGADR